MLMAKYWAHHLSIWSHWPYLSFATKSTSIVRFWQFWPWTMLRELTMLMLLLLLQLLLLLLLLQLLLLLLLLQLLLLQLLMVDGLVKVVQEVGDQGRDDKQDEASVRHFWKLKDRLNCQSNGVIKCAFLTGPIPTSLLSVIVFSIDSW